MARNLDDQMDLFKPLEVLPTDEFGNIQEPLPDPNAPEYQQMRKNFAKDFVKGAITSPVTAAGDMVDLGAMLPESSNPTSMYSGVEQAFQSLSDLGVTRENAERLIKDTTGIELKGTAGEMTGEIVGLPMAATADLLGTLTKTAAKYGPDVNKYITNIADEARETFRAASSGDDFDGMSPALATAGDTSTQTQKMLDKPDLPDTSISPTMIGTTTEPGRRAVDDYVEAYDNNPSLSKEELFFKTGVYEGRDGKYRYELDTSNAKLTNPAEVGGKLSVIDKAKKKVTRLIKGEQNPIQALKEGDRVTLDSVLDFPELYEAYDMPFLSGTKVKSPKTLREISVDIVAPDGSNGAYYPKADIIDMNVDLLKDPDTFLSTLLHEVQHAVQNREGFTSGSNTRHFENKEIKKLNLPGVADRDDFDTVLDSIYTYNDAIAPSVINDSAVKVGINNPELGKILNIDTVNHDVDYTSYQALKNVISVALKNKIYYGPDNSAYNPKKLLNQELTPEDFRLRLYELDEAVNDAEIQDWLAVESFEQNDVEDIINTASDIVVNATPLELMGILKDDVKYNAMLDVMVMNDKRVEQLGVYNYARKYGELEARLIQDRLKHRKMLQGKGFSKQEIETQMREKFPPLDMTMHKAIVEGGDYELSKKLDVTEADERKVFFPESQALLDETSDSASSVSAKSVDLPPPEAAQKTQIATTGPTYTKAKTLLDEANPEGKTLDFGAGRGLGAKEIGADTYEPFPREGFDPTYTDASSIPDASYEKLTSLNVLNVVPREMRDGIVKDIGRVLKPNGQAIVTTRGRDVLDAKGKKGPEDMSIITSSGTYQKGFTQKELMDYVKETLGEGYTVEPVKGLGKAGVKITKDGQEFMLNEGGVVPMKKQMELFNEGGLADEGGTVDPVSGNDVPVGSTQKEVRDDIPAQLSEGEFVLPADVVRYHGLEKIMQLRDEAKQGLQKMEDMGQMGNSDEAVLDDDIPFSIEDLDMEDDGVLEYNQGGVVPQQGFTGIGGYQPSQFTNYQPQVTPYQAPQMPSTYTAPTQQYVPTAPQMQQGQIPTFESFVAPLEGQAPENREYINPETGERRTFVFIGGNPSSQIPEGFIPASDYVAPEPTETKVTPTTGQTSVARQDNGDAADERRRREEERFGPGAGRIGIGGDVYGISFDDVGLLESRGMLVNMAFTGRIPEEMQDDITVNIQRDNIKFSVTGREYNELKQTMEDSGANSEVTKTKFKEILNQANLRDAEKMQKEKEEQLKQARKEASRVYAERAGKEAEKKRQAALTAREVAIAAEQARARQQQQDRDDNQGSTYTPASSREEAQSRVDSFTERTGISRAYGGRAKGGYIDKQMKKSGLASKK